MDRPLKVYIIAGESSGDLLGGHLMRALKDQSQAPISFYGVGGEKMAAEGVTSIFPYQELSMMGFLEILPYILKLMARINLVVEDILSKQPDVVITIDSPGFCFRVVEKLREEKCLAKFVHYVAPSVWAYKPERAEKCARLFDHLLTLLPFEPPYFEKVGLASTWVGHAVVSETKTGDGAAFRQKYEITPETLLFCLLPGSRKGEVKRHMPILAKAITMLSDLYPDLAIAVTVPNNVMNYIAPYFKDCPFRAIVTSHEQDRKDALAASDIAIVKSGTVALEVTMAGAPMIITYRVNPISAWFFRRMSLTKYANLVNILLQKEVIPELLQELCNPLMLANAAVNLLSSKEKQNYQKEEGVVALQKLLLPNGESSSHKAAAVVLKILS